MRDVPIPPAPLPAPLHPERVRLVWAPWAQTWQVFCAPCEMCDRIAPLVFPEGVCRHCAKIGTALVAHTG